MPTKALCWIRRDLRLSDHAALAAATGAADEVGVVFVFDTRILDALPDRDDRRVSFIHRSLYELDRRLKARGSRLIVRYGDPVVEIPRAMEAYGAESVYAARDYEPYALQRDRDVAAQIPLRLVKDSVILEPTEVLTHDGGPHRMYRSFKIAWRKAFRYDPDAREKIPDLGKLMRLEHGGWLGLPKIGFSPSELAIEAGEGAANRRLEAFAKRIRRYEQKRDLAEGGSSQLSVDLRFGTVSPRACVRLALDAGVHGEKWLSELIWRDYYQSVLFHFPEVVDQAYQETYRSLNYPGSDEHFEAWKEGQTGYPIVDAAMRCLWATGWIDNRLRLIAAGFLAKNLLIDYRRGEAWFARQLFDFDLAPNNGNWQWVASTGTDPQPFFRAFNPILQSEKVDPDGQFIHKWVPELKALKGKALHFPADFPLEVEEAGVRLGLDYPEPLVDQKATREQSRKFLEGARLASN